MMTESSTAPGKTAPESDKDAKVHALTDKFKRPSLGSWSNFAFPLFQMRFKPVFWILLVIGLAGFLFYGFKPAGSYAGYDAGSIFLHDRYTDYGTGSLRESMGMMSADQLNAILDDMRSDNEAPFWCFVVLLFAVLAGLLMLGRLYSAIVFSTGAIMSTLHGWNAYFEREYQREYGHSSENLLDMLFELPISRAGYMVEYLLRADTDERLAQSGLDEKDVRDMRAMLADMKSMLAVFLFFDNLRFNAAGKAVPIFGGSSVQNAPEPSSGNRATGNGDISDVPDVPLPSTGNVPAASPSVPQVSLPPAPAPASPTVPSPVVPSPARPEGDHCAHCGGSLPVGARYCGHCGIQVQASR